MSAQLPFFVPSATSLWLCCIVAALRALLLLLLIAWELLLIAWELLLGRGSEPEGLEEEVANAKIGDCLGCFSDLTSTMCFDG